MRRTYAVFHGCSGLLYLTQEANKPLISSTFEVSKTSTELNAEEPQNIFFMVVRLEVFQVKFLSNKRAP
jgi:hypothetical protein